MGSRDDCRGERPRKANEGPRHAMEEAGENRRPQDKPLERSAIGRRVPGPAKALEALPAPYPFGESVWFPGKLLQWAHLIVRSRPSGLEQAAPSGSPERPAPTLGWRRNSPPSLIRTAAAYCCRLNRGPSPGGILGRRRSPPSVLPGCPPGKGACRIPLCPPVDLRRNRRFPPPRHRYVGHPDLPGRRQRPRVAGSGFPHIV